MIKRDCAWSAVDIVIDIAAECGVKFRRGDFELVEESVDIVTESENNLVKECNLVASTLLGAAVAIRYDFKRTSKKLKERKRLFEQYTCCVVGWKGVYFKFSREELEGPYKARRWAEDAVPETEEMSFGGCSECVCRDCELWWSRKCPHGDCYDNHRAKVKPYDVCHPNKAPRTGWTNWYKDQAFWCRGGTFYPCKECEHFIPHEESEQTQLFDFTEEKRGLESRGHPSAWVDMTVDPTEDGALFLPFGRIGSRQGADYKSACPYYEGYWLRGGLGSVQCAAHDGLIPGLQWDKFCSKCYEDCRIFRHQTKGDNNG